MTASLDEIQTVLRQKMLGKNNGGRGEIRKTFKYFDKAGTGVVSYDSFMNVLRHENMVLSDAQAKELMRAYDTDGECCCCPP